MNGRCETDAFDQAVDVCDSCYGEFCQSCLLQPKGRKHPICRDCAIIISGVRPGAKPVKRGARKTAPERRAALQAAPREESFQYFDVPPAQEGNEGKESQADEPGDVEVAARQRSVVAGPHPGSTEVGATTAATSATTPATPTATSGSTSAVDQLDLIRGGPASPPDGQPPAGATDHPTGEHDHRAAVDDHAPTADQSPEPDEHRDDDGGSGFRRPRPFIEGEDGNGPRGMAALLEHHQAKQAQQLSPPSADPRPGRPEPGAAPAPLPRRRGEAERAPATPATRAPVRPPGQPLPRRRADDGPTLATAESGPTDPSETGEEPEQAGVGANPLPRRRPPGRHQPDDDT